MTGLDKRILEVNKKRIKVVKPGSKTSFPTTEIRGTYAPPFHVSIFQARAPCNQISYVIGFRDIDMGEFYCSGGAFSERSAPSQNCSGRRERDGLDGADPTPS